VSQAQNFCDICDGREGLPAFELRALVKMRNDFVNMKMVELIMNEFLGQLDVKSTVKL